jgi:hypothetical protein
MITGLAVGINTIVPGAMLSDNFNITYGLGHLTILPAPYGKSAGYNHGLRDSAGLQRFCLWFQYRFGQCIFEFPDPFLNRRRRQSC